MSAATQGATAPEPAARRFPRYRELPLWARAVIEGLLVAFVMLGLSLMMVGFEVRDVPGGLQLVTRFTDVFFVCVIGFVGRVALVMLREQKPGVTLAICVPIALALLFLLLSEAFMGASGASLKWILPFKSSIVMWIVLIVTVIIIIRALRAARGARIEMTVEEREKAADRAGAVVQRISTYLGPFLVFAAIALPWIPYLIEGLFPGYEFPSNQLMAVAILVMTYVMLGWGLNIVVGLAGLLDLGYVAFYAVGAYSYALSAQFLGIGFWLALPFAGLMAASFGVLLGFPVLRLRGDYLAIVTLGFGEIIRVILENWYSLTGGPDGVLGIPRPSFFGLEMKAFVSEGQTFAEYFGLEFSAIHRLIFLYYLILILALITNLFTLRIRKLPVGRAWEALREDEIACRSLGINPTNTKLTAFGIGAMFAGFAGSFFATHQGFINPKSFTFIESAIILAIVVLGGMGSQVGVVFAAILLIGLPEYFRELQEYRMLAFGAAMVIIMLWRPRGLLAHREPTLRLFPKRTPAEMREAAR